MTIFNYFLNNSIRLKSELSQIENASNKITKVIVSLPNIIEEDKRKEIREYQDFIYLKRRNWTMIPDYIYKIDLIHRKYFYEISENKSVEKSNETNLKDQALKIVDSLRIIEFLSKYGRTEIVGSVANDLILNRDIDVHVLTKKDIYEIKEKVITYLSAVNLVSNIKVEDYKNEKQAVCVIIENYSGWNIEVWICNSEKFVGFNMREKLRNQLNEDKRKIIMNLKNYYYKRGVLQGEMSTLIYNGVLDGNVRDIESFQKYLENIEYRI